MSASMKKFPVGSEEHQIVCKQFPEFYSLKFLEGSSTIIEHIAIAEVSLLLLHRNCLASGVFVAFRLERPSGNSGMFAIFIKPDLQEIHKFGYFMVPPFFPLI